MNKKEFKFDIESLQKAYDFAVSLLESRRPFDVTKGIDFLFDLVEKNPNNADLYETLKETARQHSEHIQQIEEGLKALATDMAKDVLQEIQTLANASENTVASNVENIDDIVNESLSEILEKADDKYYAAEYDQAIKLYQAVLEKDPSNQIAHEQLKKAELLRGQEKISRTLPREAIQFYRRARSYVNAGDVNSAANLLQAALDAVEKEGLTFPEAQELFDSLQDAIVAADFKRQADEGLKERDWKKAVDNLKYALRLDSTDSITKKLLEQIENLQSISTQVNILERAPGSISEQRAKYILIRKSLEKTESGIATEGLYNDLAERIGLAGIKLAEQLLNRAESTFEKAEKALLLQVKDANYAEATKYFQDVEDIVGTSFLGNSSSTIDILSERLKTKGDCENNGELAKQYYESIGEMKNRGRFPDDVRQSEVDAWSKFAPNDPDVKRARDFIVERAQKLEAKRLEEQKESRRKRAQVLSYAGGVTFILVAIFLVTLPWLSKGFLSLLPPTPTTTLTPSPTLPPTDTPIPTFTPRPSSTPVKTITPYPTVTPSGIAITLIGDKAAYLEPSKNSQVIGSIPKNTQLSILDKKTIGGINWYFCQWNVNGINRQGWVSDDYLTLVTPPSP